MMPVNALGMGYSQHTAQKEDDFYYLVHLVAQKVRGYEIYRRRQLPFWYIDTHAGCGNNRELGIAGSPLQAVNAIQDAGLSDYHVILCDTNEENCSQLNEEFHENKKIAVLNKDCRDVLRFLPDIISGYGIMVVDPNGDPYFQDLIAFYQREETSKIDLVIRLGATNYKRLVGAFDYIDLYDSLQAINKTFWYVKGPTRDNFQWTTIFGTNNSGLRPAKNKMNFFNITTNSGQAIINELNHNRKTNYLDFKEDQLPISAFGKGGKK